MRHILAEKASQAGAMNWHYVERCAWPLYICLVLPLEGWRTCLLYVLQVSRGNAILCRGVKTKQHITFPDMVARDHCISNNPGESYPDVSFNLLASYKQ